MLLGWAVCGQWAWTQPPATNEAALAERPTQYLGSVPAPAILGNAAVVMDAETGTVLCSLRPDEQMYPASLTKILMAIVVVSEADLDEMVTVAPEAAAIGETTMNLKAGQKLTVRELLQGALIGSANDAAAALAIHVAGSLRVFSTRMNATAQRMGVRSSHFTNPHGLHDPRHYTTARDMALIARQFSAYKELWKIAATQQITLRRPGKPGGGVVRNRNRLLGEWDECDGIKTGYTRQAGNCIAASATRDRWRLICIVLDSKEIVADSHSLLEWGFDNFQRIQLAKAGLTRRVVEVEGGIHSQVDAIATESSSVVLPQGGAVVQEVLEQDIIRAPVKQGQTVAIVKFHLPNGETRAVPLVAGNNVPATLWWRVRTNPNLLLGCLALLIVSGGALVYGTAAKIAGARRGSFPAG